MSIKEKTVNGMIWSFVDSFANQGVQFIIGIVLARMLSPHEFGLVGMLTIFIAVSQSFIDSGFTQALIRKQDIKQTDYSTVFYFNAIVGVVCFLILFLAAGYIADFFNEPILKPLVRVLGLSIVINSLAIIQRTTLTKRIDFKLQAKISLISSLISGIIGIGMAFYGYGVWSLVWKTLSGYLVVTVLLWIWNRWKPTLEFSHMSFKELFSFGSKLLVSGLINTIYENVYYLIIGKYFSAVELGFYSRADQFKAVPSQNLTAVIQKVSYPVLSTMQDDKIKLKAAYKKLIKTTMLITFVLMLGMAASAKPMVLTLIGDKWEPCIIYLQMLCVVGMFFPLHALNLNMLNVMGRSDLFLKLEIIKKILAVPTIVIGIILGIKVMIIGMMVNTVIAYYLNSYWSGKFIGYSVKEQVADIFPSFLWALLISSLIFITGLFIQMTMPVVFSIQIIAGIVFAFILFELFRQEDYLYIKEIVKEKLFGIKLNAKTI